MARILVVDDEPDVCQLVSAVLQRANHQVLVAEDGDAALALIRAEQPDLAVVDVLMPGINGLDLVKAMAADAQLAHIPVILLSARGEAQDIEAGIAVGATNYMPKPFTPEELTARVALILAVSNDQPSA